MASYSPNASAHYEVFATNLLRTALTDYFFTVGAQGSRDTTTKDTNATASYKAAYSSGSNQTNDATAVTYLTDDYSYRKIYGSIRFQLSAAPTTTPIILIKVFGYYFQINTAGTIVPSVGTYEAGHDTPVTPSTGAFHLFEFIVDKDWKGFNQGALLYRVDGGTYVQSNLNNLTFSTAIQLGDSYSKATGANCNVWYNHVAVVATDDVTRLAPWINDRTVEQDSRVPIATGNHTDFTGVGDTTNKYNNIDESPSNSTTDYNYGGDDSSTKRQSFTYTAKTYSPDTPKEYSIFNVIASGEGQPNQGDFKSLVRDNSVTYDKKNNTSVLPAVKTFVPVTIGGVGRPADNSALSSTILNSLEGGVTVVMPATTNTRVGNNYQTKGVFSADGATYDGTWVDETGSSAGSAYTKVDPSTGNDSTYITTNTINAKQGFTIGSFSPTPPNLDTTIYGIRLVIGGMVVNSGETVKVALGFRTGGVDYLCSQSNYVTMSSASFGEQLYNLLWNYPTDQWFNPATGTLWTQSQLTSYEWFFQLISTTGTAGIKIVYAYIVPLMPSKLLQTASFMVVTTGTAATDNGAVVGIPNEIFNINQSVKRSNYY